MAAGSGRIRWAAIGAAVAVTLGAGGVSLGQAAIGSGKKPVFVAIEPCRLVDTRPGTTNIGGRTAPLSARDTLTLQVTGSTGQCTSIPAGATAAALNVTAIQGSTRSFLAVYPADAPLPNASNLNWNGGDPPTPNKVDVALSPGGAVKITNDAGTVHVAADLVGYYTDHHHDDRYYTKSQTNARIAAAAPSPIEMSQGIDWVPNAGNPSLLAVFENAVEINGGMGGTAHLSLRGPASIAGTRYRLASVEYCMTTFLGGGFVDEASIIGLGNSIPGDVDEDSVEAEDGTNRSAAGCYTIQADATVGDRKSHHLQLFVIGTIYVSQVTATWVTM